MSSRDQNNSPLYEVENIIGCKWSLRVVEALRSGKKRPGEIRRSIQGISEKVLNERLKKLVRFRLVNRKIYPVTPPKVEYSFTAKGKKFIKILDAITKL